MEASALKHRLKAGGWTLKRIALRWNLSARRVSQIVQTPERNGYYDDAFFGLLSDFKDDYEGREGIGLTVAQIKALIKAKGWKQKSIAQRWGLSERRLSQIVTDPQRNLYYDDAIRGLPTEGGS